MTSELGRYGVLLYAPVVHEGYREWLSRHLDADFFALVGERTIAQRRPLLKDLRRLQNADVIRAFIALGVGHNWRELEFDDLPELQGIERLVMPKDPLFTQVIELLPSRIEPMFESAFLRWHEGNVELEQSLPTHTFSSQLVNELSWDWLRQLASWSPDWWRQVAAVLVHDGEPVIWAYNQPLPSDEAVQYLGDPRALFRKGVQLELSSFLHAESAVIAEAARRGIATEGAELWVTTFPCPVCAKLVSQTGVSRLRYRSGYSVLDGERVLRAAGIELICE